jgi:hypothetical protein
MTLKMWLSGGALLALVAVLYALRPSVEAQLATGEAVESAQKSRRPGARLVSLSQKEELRSGEISGVVETVDHEPLPGAEVCVWGSAADHPPMLDRCLATDESGSFALVLSTSEALPRLNVSAPGFVPRWHELEPFGDTLEQRLVIALAPASGWISGRVTDASGGTLAAAVVSVHPLTQVLCGPSTSRPTPSSRPTSSVSFV